MGWWRLTHATIFLLLLGIASPVSAHGRLMSPPSRSSMWRMGYDTPKNYDDNQLFCGGLSYQKSNGMRCGVCGDPWGEPAPRSNEMGGVYYKGIITRKYQQGEIITSTVDLTANHLGFFEFRLCPVNENAAMETEECMAHHPLEVIGEGRRMGESLYQYFVPRTLPGTFKVLLRIPNNITCTHCVFQWTYTAGNNWGTCENGTQAVGCGPQETFRGCADVSVGTNSGESSHIPVPVPPSVPVSQPTARFFKPFRPHYQVPKRKQSFSQLQPPLKSKPTLRPTHRPLYSSSTLSWEYWNSANAWPNTVSPGYPYGKPSTTTWFYHQWPATPKPTSRPQRFPEYEDWPSTPDLKTSPRPLPGSHGWTSSTPRYLYPSRRPIVHSDLYFGYPRPRFTSLSPHLPEQEWPSTFDLETSLRSHPERKPPHRKWNPEINDFPNDVSISLKSVNVPAVMTTSLATHPPTHLPTHPPTQPPPQSPTHSPPRPSSKLPPYLPLQPTTLPANKISTNRPVLVISLASGHPPPGRCHGSGAFVTFPGIDGWCMDNCNHMPPYCPPSHCQCD